MAFNKYQINAVKKIQNILKMEFFNPEILKKQVKKLQETLKNIENSFSKTFNKIKTENDANEFVMNYLNNTVSKESFSKIKENYEKTKQIAFNPVEISKKEEKKDFVSELFGALSKETGIDFGGLGDVMGQLGLGNISISEEQIEKSFNKGLTKDLLDKVGKEKLEEIGWTKEDNDKFAKKAAGLINANDDEVDEFLDRLYEDDPTFAKKVEEIMLADDDIDESYEKGVSDGKEQTLKQLNFPSSDEINKATNEWRELKEKEEIQKKIKSGKTIKIDKPYIKNINGNCVKISEINTNEFEIKDPKKCCLLFIDENGKVHQINKCAFEKGKWQVSSKKGLALAEQETKKKSIDKNK